MLERLHLIGLAEERTEGGTLAVGERRVVSMAWENGVQPAPVGEDRAGEELVGAYGQRADADERVRRMPANLGSYADGYRFIHRRWDAPVAGTPDNGHPTRSRHAPSLSAAKGVARDRRSSLLVMSWRI